MNSGAPNVPNLLSNMQTVEMYYKRWHYST